MYGPETPQCPSHSETYFYFPFLHGPTQHFPQVVVFLFQPLQPLTLFCGFQSSFGFLGQLQIVPGIPALHLFSLLRRGLVQLFACILAEHFVYVEAPRNVPPEQRFVRERVQRMLRSARYPLRCLFHPPPPRKTERSRSTRFSSSESKFHE